MPRTAPARQPNQNDRRPTLERNNVRGEATRQLMIKAAERLFAERGITAVPLRDIGIAVGSKNHNAVQYHFGDRDELVKAILESRGAESEAHRAQVVTNLMLGKRTPAVADVVDAFVRPLAIHVESDNHYLAFLSLLITEQGGYEALSTRGIHAGASVLTLGTLLERLVADVPPAILEERWSLARTSAVHALARYQSAQQKRQQLPAKIDVLIDDLVAFLAAGLIAPVAAKDPRNQ